MARLLVDPITTASTCFLFICHIDRYHTYLVFLFRSSVSIAFAIKLQTLLADASHLSIGPCNVILR